MSQVKDELRKLTNRVKLLEARLDAQDAINKTLSNVIDNHANVLTVMSMAINLVSDRLGITNEQVIAALADAVKKHAEGKRNQSESQGINIDNSGKSGSGVSDQSISGNDPRFENREQGSKTSIGDQLIGNSPSDGQELAEKE